MTVMSLLSAAASEAAFQIEARRLNDDAAELAVVRAMLRKHGLSREEAQGLLDVPMDALGDAYRLLGGLVALAIGDIAGE